MSLAKYDNMNPTEAKTLPKMVTLWHPNLLAKTDTAGPVTG